MDDFFVPIESQSAEDLIPDMLLVAEVVHAAAIKYGLAVNFAQGQTEALAAPRGPGAPGVRALLANVRDPDSQLGTVALLVPMGDLGHLRIVQMYNTLAP